jgi:hypothetical protein
MIIIYGWRWYGLAFARGGHGAKTKSFHVFYIPFVPYQQMWVVQEGGGRLRGIPIRWSWRAALTTVGLPWAAIATSIAAAISPFAAVPVGAAALAGWIWAMKGARAATGREAQRRELTARVLHTNCPPMLLTDAMAGMVSNDLDGAWANACPDRSPEDVAALGPRDQHEAALAFTLLSVRARLERGELADQLRDRAEQVIDALARMPTLPEGAPYRAELRLPETAA